MHFLKAHWGKVAACVVAGIAIEATTGIGYATYSKVRAMFSKGAA